MTNDKRSTYTNPPKQECYTCPSLRRSAQTQQYSCEVYSSIVKARSNSRGVCASWGKKWATCSGCEIAVDTLSESYYNGQCASCNGIDHRMKIMDIALDMSAKQGGPKRG